MDQSGNNEMVAWPRSVYPARFRERMEEFSEALKAEMTPEEFEAVRRFQDQPVPRHIMAHLKLPPMTPGGESAGEVTFQAADLDQVHRVAKMLEEWNV